MKNIFSISEIQFVIIYHYLFHLYYLSKLLFTSNHFQFSTFNFQLLKYYRVVRISVQFHFLPADKASQKGEQTDTTDEHRENNNKFPGDTHGRGQIQRQSNRT